MLLVLMMLLVTLAVGAAAATLKARRLQRELRSVRHKLDHYEEWLPWMLSATKLLAWEADPVGDIVSRPFQVLDGLPRERAPETLEQFVAAVHPEDRARFLQAVRDLSEVDTPLAVEVRVVAPDGAIGHIHSVFIMKRDAHGRPERIMGVTEDITARKTAEVELRKAEERLTRAVRGSSDGMFDIDLVSGEMWWDGFFERQLGYSSGEFPKNLKEFAALIHPDDNAARVLAMDKYLRGEVPLYELDYRALTKGGEWLWFHVRGQVDRDDSGNPVRLSGMTQEVSARREYQQALIEATEAAAAASRAKSEFLANMSHEIRTPMNGVIGMSELLLETKLDTVQRDCAETIRDSGAALLTVINDILDFSKVEAGKLELEHLDMDLRETFEDIARLLAVQAHAKGLEVTAHVDPALPLVVKGDPGRLRQILLNLGGNAVKFTDGGEVAIELKVLESTEHGTLVRCEVRDTGVGIPADRIGSLFQPFTQVDASTTRKFGGSGLGLSIAHRLTVLMGGETGVESQLGVGSTFWFTAQLGLGDQCMKTQRPSPTALNARRILVVDDNATNRKVLLSQLRSCGIEPVCVSSAAQALQAMAQAHEAQRPFEVALIDHHMPEGDGAELGQRISNDARYAATRLVMLTSASQLGDIQKFTQLGFAGYLLKPVTQNDLMQCLMLALSVPAEQWQLQTQPIVTRDVLHAQRAYSQSRVLLAEDNVVNQKVTSRIVEKLGFRVDIVASGVEAVAAWSTGHYDLILMDCQMPIMDGYDATREIRKLEREPRHIPIVALTAHAMKGADEQCRLAGMDDYLTKPIDRAVLETVLKRYLSDAPLQDNATNMKSASASSASADDPPVDWEALIEATDQDGDLIRELTTLFIGSSDVGVAAIARAIATADFDAVRRKAHEIKGVSANMHAQKLSSTAAQIEEAIEAGEYGHVATLADELRREMARTVDYLRAKTA